MRGINEIRMNAQTMREAVQEYLDRRAVSQTADYVTCIKVNSKYIAEFQVVVRGKGDDE